MNNKKTKFNIGIALSLTVMSAIFFASIAITAFSQTNTTVNGNTSTTIPSASNTNSSNTNTNATTVANGNTSNTISK
jgi:hypothetical protein